MAIVNMMLLFLPFYHSFDFYCVAKYWSYFVYGVDALPKLPSSGAVCAQDDITYFMLGYHVANSVSIGTMILKTEMASLLRIIYLILHIEQSIW